MEANAEYSRKYIKTPYVPVEFFGSFWDNYGINKAIKYQGIVDENILTNILQYYFKVDNDFYYNFGGPGQIADVKTTNGGVKHCMLTTQSNEPLSEILKKVCINASQLAHYHDDPSTFIIICHKKRIAFATYKPSHIL